MKLSLLVLLLIPTTLLKAQKQSSLTDFGKVDEAALRMKECSFDKAAEAMFIFDEAESLFKLNIHSNSPVFQQTEHHTRIKIFNKKGFDQANVKIRYRNDKEVFIKNFSAQTYNLDEAGNIVITKVDKSSVYDKQINKRYSERIFAFPDVKEGSILEYSYILDGVSEGKWYFQKSIPVQISRFIVRFPEELRVSAVPYATLPVQKGQDRISDGQNSWYTMQNIPALKDEPYMSCREDYLQSLELKLIAIELPNIPRISLLRTWPGIIKELMDDEDFGKQLKKYIPRTADLDAMLQRVSDPYQRMQSIHKYVRNNMEWNNYYSLWAMSGVKSAWKDKKGTSGEINLILINLLRDAGINVSPVLVSTKKNGVVNTSSAGYDQFNKVMAYVEIGEKHYVLDATEKETPSHLIPLDVIASEGLVIQESDNAVWGWKVLWDNEHKFKNNVFINAIIDENGRMTGRASIASYDYEKVQALELLKKGKDKLAELKRTQPGILIDSFQVADAENDTLPLTQEFKFTAPTNSSGAYHYFSLNYFTGFDKNPFIADERQTDIFYGAVQHHMVNAVVFLPEGYTMHELPANIKMMMPDTSIIFKRYSSFNDDMLSFQVSLEFKSPTYTTEAYPELKEFFKKMYVMLDEKFVYRKK